jgi:hypothetical protein
VWELRSRQLAFGAALALVMAAALAIPARGGQYQGPPAHLYVSPSVLLPTDYKQCTALDQEWQKIRVEVNRQHDACLREAKPSCPDDPVTTCSCMSCASYHDAFKLGQKEVEQCRADVSAHLQREQQKKDEAERIERQRQEAERKRDQDARDRKEREEREQARKDQERKDRDTERQQERELRDREREARDRKREEDEKRLDQAREQSRLAQEMLARRTEARNQERERIQDDLHAANQRFHDDVGATTRQAEQLIARLEQGIAESFNPTMASAAASPSTGDVALSGFDFPDSMTPAPLDTRQLGERMGVALSEAGNTLRDWTREEVRGGITTARDFLINAVVEDESITDLAGQIIDGTIDDTPGIERLAGRLYDGLTDDAVNDLSADLGAFVKDTLRTGTGISLKNTWAANLGNAVVERGVSLAVNSAVETIRYKITETAGQAWDSVMGYGPPPDEGTFARVEYDFWKAASPSNLILKTLPGRGPAAVKGLYDYGATLVDNFSKVLGFAIDDISGSR